MKAYKVICQAIVIMVFLPTMVSAKQDSAMLLLLKSLYENGTIDAATYALVVQAAEADATAQQGTDVRESQIEKISTAVIDKRLLTMNAAIKASKSRIKIGGRMQIEAAAYNGQGQGHNDGTKLRRVSLFAKGELSPSWAYKFQYEFTGTGINGIQDAYIDYTGLQSVKLRLGHFKEPFSLQDTVSANNSTFIERALPHVFAEGRHPGLLATYSKANWSARLGLYADGRDAASADHGAWDEGWAVAGRLVWSPMVTKKTTLHVGFSGSHRLSGAVDTLRFRARPESRVTASRIVDTGHFDGKSLTRFVVETAWAYDSFHVSGEYYYTMVDRDIDSHPDLNFSGFYVEAAYYLTGESLNYQAGVGRVGGVNPHTTVGEGGWGAWQLVSRFSRLDLNDADIHGGEADSFTLGLNWYATQNIRFSANYVNILDIDGGPANDSDLDIFQVRAQLIF